MKNNIFDTSFIEKYNGYVIRAIPRHPSLIATPIKAKCFYHSFEDDETGNEGVKIMERMIDEDKE